MYHLKSTGAKIKVEKQPVPQTQAEFDLLSVTERIALYESDPATYEKFAHPKKPWE